jgi:hypothetical protein
LFRAPSGYQRIHPNDFTARVEQRSPGIAGIDCGVSLQRLIDRWALRFLHRANGADNSRSHGPVQTKRIADRVHVLTYLQVTRFGQDGWSEVLGVDLQQRQIVCLVLQNDLRFVGVLIAGGHLDVLRVLDDMVVGNNAAVFGEHEAGTLTALWHHPVKEVEGQSRRSDIHDGG